MGGSTPRTPAAPSISQTSQQSIDEQIKALPQMLAAQTEFGPKFSQLELDQLKQFGPAYAEVALNLEKQFGPQLAEQTRAEQKILAPERIAGSDYLTKYLGEEDFLTPQEELQATQTMRAGQAERGMAFSGQSSADELKALTEMRQALKSRKIQTALSMAEKVPTSASQTVGTSYGGTNQLVQNVTPAQTFGLAASNYATGANVFGQQSQNQQYQQSFWGDVIGGGIGGFAKLATRGVL